MVKIVNSNEFKEITKEGIVIVDFFATWCGPCKMLSPIFEELAVEMNSKLDFIKVDVDQCGDIAAEFGIQTIPTMIILVDGKVVETMTGFLPKESIKSSIEKYL
ncbi:MAG: thioredoxin [Paraclostridium sp.]